MEKWFAFSTNDFLAVVITAICIYIAVIILTRISGKRSFTKMSSFDFALTVAIGSIVASVIVSKSVSLGIGITGLVAVYGLQLLAAKLRQYSWFQKIIDNKPLLLMDGEQILYHNLKKAKVTESDLIAKLREANVLDYSQVRAVVFEATGDVSVLHTSNSDRKLSPKLMQDVKHH